MSQIQQKAERLERQLEREKDDQETRGDRMALLLAWAGARVGSQVFMTLVPSMAGIAPIAEIVGGGYLIYKGIDPREKNAGAKLGGGMGLATGAIDRVGEFLVGAVSKFKAGKAAA
jgi:hypothetical protein